MDRNATLNHLGELISKAPTTTIVNLIATIGPDDKNVVGKLWSNIGDEVTAVIINPEVDVTLYLFSRFFKTHAEAVMESEGSDESELASRYLEAYKIDIRNDETWDIIKEVFATYLPLQLVSLMEGFDEKVADLAESFSAPASYKSIVITPESGSLISMMKHAIDQDASSRDGVMNKFGQKIVAGALGSMSPKFNVRDYALAMWVCSLPHAIKIASSPDLSQKFLSDTKLNLTGKGESWRSLRKIVSYHPKVLRIIPFNLNGSGMPSN